MSDSTATSVGRDPDSVDAAGASAYTEEETYFLMRVASALYAVAADSVEHVSAAETPVRVPTAPAHLLGVVNLRGRILTMVDLPAVLGLTSADSSTDADRNRRMVVLRAADVPFACLADHVLGLRPVPRSEVRTADATGEAIDGLLVGTFDAPEGRVTILSTESLLRALIGRGVEGERTQS